MTSIAPKNDPGITCYFHLKIDDQELGSFHSCHGLSASVETHQHQEGGNNSFVWQFPTRIRFSNITLSRPLTPDSAKVMKWVSSITTGIRRPTGEISAIRADGSLVARWGLMDVLPVNWQGPVLEVDGNAVATEVLEIAHHGFTVTAGAS